MSVTKVLPRVAVGITAVLFLLFVLPTMAFAQEQEIEEGEEVYGGITLMDGDLTIDEGAIVHGDVVLMNGDLELEGTVNGSVVLFNGNLALEGQVNGDVLLMNGNIIAERGADISGECLLLNGSATGFREGRGGTRCESLATAGWANSFPAPMPVPVVPPSVEINPHNGLDNPPSPMPPMSPPDHGGRGGKHSMGFVGGVLSSLGSAVLLGGLAFLVGLIAPAQLQRVQDTVEQKPAISGLVGLLTAVAVPSLMVILALLSVLLIIVCIGLLGFPLLFVLGVAFGLAHLLGWIAVGTAWGDKLAGWLKWHKLSRPATAMLGTFALTLGIGLLGLIPLVPEGLITAVITLIGLGAVALTQFGMKPYPRHQWTGTAVPPVNQDKVDEVLTTLPPQD
jgi:hypothetical protein